MDFLKDIFGTGANIFGAGGNNTDSLVKNGLLQQTDVDKAGNQSLMRGLLGTAVGYLAQPKNQGYGSSIPYLAKGLQNGMDAAQKPYDQLTKDAGQNMKLEDYNSAKLLKDNKEAFNKGLFQPNSSITQLGRQADPRLNKEDQNGNITQVAPNFNPVTSTQKPVFDSEKYLQASLAKGNINGEDYFKYKNLLNPTKDPISVAAGGALFDPVTKQQIFRNPKDAPDNLTANYRDYSMTTNNPTPEGFNEYINAQNESNKTELTLNDGENLNDKEIRDWYHTTQQSVNAGILQDKELAYAEMLINEAGASVTSGQGFGSDLITKADAIFDRLGIVRKGSSASHYLNALKTAQIKLALGEKKPGTGPMTDQDFINFLNTQVQTSNPATTNKIIAYASQRKQQMMEDYAEALTNHVKEFGYTEDAYQFERKWNRDMKAGYIAEMKQEIRNIISDGPGGVGRDVDAILETDLTSNNKNNGIPI